MQTFLNGAVGVYVKNETVLSTDVNKVQVKVYNMHCCLVHVFNVGMKIAYCT